MSDDAKRAQAIKSLECLRDSLEKSQRAHPERNALTPASEAERFNEILVDAIDVLGEGYVRIARFYKQMFIPASGKYPMESVSLTGLLVSVHDVLRKLNTIDPADPNRS